MKHISKEDWARYIKGELDEGLRELYEDHLYDCDQCLALYMEAVEAIEMQIPMITLDGVMQEVEAEQVSAQATKINKPSFYKRTIFHYTVAAAMTLILMSSGFFSHLMHVVGDFESAGRNKTSIISEIMDTSISIIDKVEWRKGE